jgi:hypothetical protein
MTDKTGTWLPKERLSDNRVWIWDTGIGNSSLENIACLTETHFYVWMSVVNPFRKQKILQSLQTAPLPEPILKGAIVLPLPEITELRYSESAGMLEVHDETGNCAVIFDKQQLAHQDVYKQLRLALAPGFQPVAGRLTSNSGLQTPITGLTITLMSGLLLCLLLFAPAKRQAPKPDLERSSLELAITEWFVPVTLTMLVATVVGFAIWIFVRWRNPPTAEVIVTGGQTGSIPSAYRL